MPTIYRKSAKGLREIETREHRLPPRLRSALILVDGKRSDAELNAMVMQPAQTLAALLEQGFIEVAGTTAVREASRPATAPAAAAAPGRTAAAGVADFESRRRAAVRELNELLGPAAESLAIRIEKAKSLEELRPLLVHGAQMIAGFRGRGAAEAFAARFVDV
jgi:hypothetical protein